MTEQPHDRYAKHFLQRADVASDLLRFILPQRVSAALDLSVLESPGLKLVDERLQEIDPDLILCTRTVNGDEVLVYVLVEHQSSVDHWMAYRINRYVVRLWEAWRAQNAKARELPPVIPVVLYHGEAAWSAKTDLGEMISGAELRRAMGGLWPSFGYVVEWINARSEDELRASRLRTVTQLMLLALAQARGSEAVASVFSRWAGLLADVFAQPGGTQDIELTLRYFTEVRDPEEIDKLRAALDAFDPRVKEALMTAAEKFREEGREKGREEGIEQGRIKQQRAILERLFVKQFGALSPLAEARIAQESSLDTLERWTDAVLSVESADAVFES
ncbi:MAG: Rpn family recombination-promoting nuclease/putative transposase [Myxococcota bacterium]